MPNDLFSSFDECRIRDPLYCTPRAETRLVEHATLDLLDSHRLAFYLNAKENESPSLARSSRPQQLHMLNLSYDGTPTLAAMLHFCPYPQGFFPRFLFFCAVVDGAEWNEEKVILKKKVTGSLTDLYEAASAFCEEQAPDLSFDAMRELLLNSLIHRDVSEAADPYPNYLVIYSDRVEIWNPYSGETFFRKEGRAGGAPDLPNPTIASIAQLLLGAELRGLGLGKASSALTDQGLPEPEFTVDGQELCVTVKRRTSSPEDMTEQLLTYCKTPRSRQEIADFLHVGTVFYAMQRYVKPLLADGSLIMTLPDKPQSSRQRFVRGASNE